MTTDGLLSLLFETAEIREVLGDRARLQGMLDFEAGLARAEGRTKVIPAAAADTIAASCRAELFDLADLALATARAGNLVIPMVERLTVLVAQRDPEAARFVHWGATSQDAHDTGLILQLKGAIALIEADLGGLATALARLASAHKATPQVGRTLLQHAVPLTFGLKAAGWLDAIGRHRERLGEIRPRLLTLQFGGAVGTFASLGEDGLAVAAALADELGLALPDLPWHTQRDRMAELGTTLALLTGTLGKIARDVALMMQTEIGEAFEPAAPGRGGSSTMPHKRNPVAAPVVLAAALRAPGLAATLLAAMVQEHERGVGGWHAEWETLPELVALAAGALRNIRDSVAGLEVDPARMRANLEATRGQIMAEAVTMALAGRIGRPAAHDRVKAACALAAAEGHHLKEVLAADPLIGGALAAEELERLFDPLAYVGLSQLLVERVLARRQD